jgi:hypothetical protein
MTNYQRRALAFGSVEGPALNTDEGQRKPRACRGFSDQMKERLVP